MIQVGGTVWVRQHPPSHYSHQMVLETASRSSVQDYAGLWCQSVNVCPARTGPLEGPKLSSEDRDLPYLASFQVKIAIVRQNCTKLGKCQGTTRI